MISNPTIAVIGGTGKSGRFLVRTLIQQGFSFRLLLRDTTSFVNPGGSLEDVVQGDVRDVGAVERLCKGCVAVISTLGQPKGQPAIFSHATRTILGAMEKWDMRRYILTTGLNVDTPADKKGSVTQTGTDWMRVHYPETTADKQQEYELLCNSDIDWTLVRLPLIGLTEESGAIETSLEDCPGGGIHAIDLARFLISQLGDSRYFKQAPFLANI